MLGKTMRDSKRDQELLHQMRRVAPQVKFPVAAGIAERLLALRDELSSEDNEWEDALTQHIATLGSASTYSPSTAKGEETARLSVDVAVREISKLLEAGLAFSTAHLVRGF